jgi:thiol:disulfide interchange protein
MFMFGLSLFGVFEITLGGAESKLSEASAQEGFGGSFVHGFFTTLLGTSCTAPLVGPVIGIAVNEPGIVIFALFGSIATGLALPYFLLTWQPAWMKFLPKPGMWMNRLKIFFGFVMVAFTVWLMSALATPVMVVHVGYFLLVLAFAAWLFGTYHDKWWRWFVMIALIAGGWAFFIKDTIVSPEPKPSGLLAAVRTGLAENRPVFVDFTADWCANCKFFERTVLETDEMKAVMKEKNVKFVKADYTVRPPDIAEALKKLGRAGVPVYVLFRKRGDAWVADSPYGLLEELKKL